jgi:hypothetical protein
MWIIHEPWLLQMRDVTHAVVVIHRKWVTKKKMQLDWFAQRVKKASTFFMNRSD